MHPCKHGRIRRYSLFETSSNFRIRELRGILQIYVCIYVCMHACMHVGTENCVFEYLFFCGNCVFLCGNVCMHVDVCMHARIYAYIHACMPKSANRIHTYKHTFMHTYAYTHTHTHTHTHAHIHTHTNAHTFVHVHETLTFKVGFDIKTNAGASTSSPERCDKCIHVKTQAA
jgi:hypothetical protein